MRYVYHIPPRYRYAQKVSNRILEVDDASIETTFSASYHQDANKRSSEENIDRLNRCQKSLLTAYIKIPFLLVYCERKKVILQIKTQSFDQIN